MENIDYSCLKEHFDKLHTGVVTDVIALSKKEEYESVARDISDVVYRYIDFMNRSLKKKELKLEMKEEDISVLYTDMSHVESNPLRGIISIILSDHGFSCWFALHSPDGEKLMPFSSTLLKGAFAVGFSEIIPGFYSNDVYIVQIVNSREIKNFRNDVNAYMRKRKGYDIKGYYNIINSALGVMIKVITKDKYYHNLSSLLSSGITTIPIYYGLLHYIGMIQKYTEHINYFDFDDIETMVNMFSIFSARDGHAWINLLNPYDVVNNLLKENYDITVGMIPIKTNPDQILLTILGYTDHENLYKDSEETETVKVEVIPKEGVEEDGTGSQV